jgi:hypothetical protein
MNISEKENLKACLEESESIILSIIVISKGLVNLCDNDNQSNYDIRSHDNLILLNITHTDSYLQNLSTRLDSLYNQLGVKYIFPLEIWQNNITQTKLSIGNINRYIYNRFINSEKMSKLRVNIMIDNLKQNIPKYNYILAPDVIDFFSQICKNFDLTKIYFSEWINVLKSNDINKLKKLIESKYNINNPTFVYNTNMGMTKNQIQYFRQYGIQETNTNIITRKRKRLEKEDNYNSDIKNNIIELEQFELNLELF